MTSRWTSVIALSSLLALVSLRYLTSPKKIKQLTSQTQPQSLSKCRQAGLVPEELKVGHFFDLLAHPFKHSQLLLTCGDVIAVLENIQTYLETYLATDSNFDQTSCVWINGSEGKTNTVFPCGETSPFDVWVSSAEDWKRGFMFDRIICPDGLTSRRRLRLGQNVVIHGGVLDLSDGDIAIDDGVVMEAGVTIKGPAIIGRETILRAGAYIRNDSIIGARCVLRCETKNSVLLDRTELPHPGYAGDSILGYHSHFGCQALTANLGLLGNTITVTCSDGITYDTGREKMGVILGDESQMGCNSVSEPGCMIGPNTHVYPLTRMQKGFYGPNEIVKNKPMEKQIVERTPLRSLRE